MRSTARELVSLSLAVRPGVLFFSMGGVSFHPGGNRALVEVTKPKQSIRSFDYAA